MEDFNALAVALGAGIADIRGCLILSSDGLVLGSSPEPAETEAKAAWVRFAALGEPERGFVQYGTEIWAYVRRGPYAAFAVTGPGVRPGLVIDQMERALLAAEEARSRREGLKVAAPSSAASTAPVVQTTPAAQPTSKKKKRSALHREPKPLEEPVVVHAQPPAPSDVSSAAVSEREGPSASQPALDAAEAHPAEPALPEMPKAPPPADRDAGAFAGDEEGEEVDRFSLAREFSQLLQDDRDDADG